MINLTDLQLRKKLACWLKEPPIKLVIVTEAFLLSDAVRTQWEYIISLIDQKAKSHGSVAIGAITCYFACTNLHRFLPNRNSWWDGLLHRSQHTCFYQVVTDNLWNFLTLWSDLNFCHNHHCPETVAVFQCQRNWVLWRESSVFRFSFILSLNAINYLIVIKFISMQSINQQMTHWLS